VKAIAVQHDIGLDVTVVSVTGPVTLGSTPKLRDVLSKSVAECPNAIVLDLTRVTTVDPVALTVVPLVAGQERHLPNVAVHVCVGAPQRHSPLVSAALGAVPVHTTVAAALAEIAGSRRPAGRTELDITPVPRSIGVAREAALTACVHWDLMHVCESVRLIVSELVTNAIVHAGRGIRLELALRDAFVHVRVRDGTTAPPRRPDPVADGPPRPGGRGLYLVDTYSSAWGYRLDGGGKMVWATVRHRPPLIRRQFRG
jgi:anti-sigma regulatory factor (Ser/Thr protein kinase)